MRIHPKRLVPFCAAALLVAVPAHALRVATWNLTAYQDGLIPSKITPRQADFRTSIAGLQPDVLIAQEVIGSTSRDSFLTNVLNFLEPGQWAGSYISSTQSAVFWKPALVSVTNVLSFATYGPRDVLQCWVHPVGYADKMATFRLYSIHLKAGDPGPDSTTRRIECTDIRTTINNTSLTNYGPNFVLGGDTNFQGAWEGGYIRLTESQTNNNGQCHDTLGTLMTGTWRDNWFYRYYHTQSPNRTPPYDYFAGGGLDDRFDLFLTSNSVQDRQGLDLHGYVTYGQDGRHMNDDINASGNDSVGYTIATALRWSSDHIPVVAVIRLPAKLGTVSQLDFGTVITDATAEQALAISNIAPWPGDSLRYSFGAPAGFTAPAGNFAQAVGDPATNQTIGMNTASAGSPSGTLTIATNNPDTLSKNVLLSGKVLRHAVASLDSLTEVTVAPLDFGDVPLFHDTTLVVAVHNLGYDPLQARLSITSAEFRGEDTRYSLTDFSPALVAGTAARFSVKFTATCEGNVLAVDTLIFHSADESLPGGAAQPDVRYLTIVSVTGVNPSLPTITRLYKPVPNPLRSSSTLRFDLAQGTSAQLEIFDLAGRRMAVVADREFAPGRYSYAWDGRKDAGASAGPGLYFVRLTGRGLSPQTVRLAVLR